MSRRSQVHTIEFCLNLTRLTILACCSQQKRSVHALARGVFLVQTDSNWVRMDEIWLQTTRYEMAVCTKWLDTILGSKLLSSVFSKRPSSNFFFLKKHPYSNKQSHSNEHPFSVSAIALFEYMCIEINNCSSSFKLFTFRPITKTVAFVSVSKLLCPCDCTIPSNEWNVCRDFSYWLLDRNKPVFHFLKSFSNKHQIFVLHILLVIKKNKRPVPDYHLFSNKHPPLVYQK